MQILGAWLHVKKRTLIGADLTKSDASDKENYV